MIKEKNFIIFLCILTLSTLFISGCVPQKSPGDINVTVQAGVVAGWNKEYWSLDFGTITRCDVVNSEEASHGIEIINKGFTPINVDIKSTDDLLTDPASNWKFKAECYAMGRTTGTLFGFAGNCWDGPDGIQDTYIDILNSDTTLVTCLNYRSSISTTKPGTRIDVELITSCQEPIEEKYGLLAVTFEEADRIIDCDGNSGYDPLVELFLPLDTDYEDHSDNSLSIIPTNYPTQTLSGQIDEAYSFNGIDNYLDYGDSLNDLKLPVTFAAWVKLDDKTSQNPIIHMDDEFGVYSGAWLMINNDNKIRTGFGGGVAAIEAYKSQYVVDANLININEWHHIASVITDHTNILIYIDGNPVSGDFDTGSYTGNIVHTVSPLTIGKRMVSDPPHYFSGDLDEVRIYNSALSQTDIQGIMEGGN